MPVLKVHQVELDEVFEDMARVAYEHRPHSKTGRIIVLKVGNKVARVMARGAPGRDQKSIYIDDATRERLGLSTGREANFTILPARFWDEFVWAWQATNPVTRVAGRLGIIALGLGAVGILAAVLPIALGC